MYDERLLDEWKNIFEDIDRAYIYGAKKTASQIRNLAVNIGAGEKIVGYVVTNPDKNPKTLDNLSVIGIHQLNDKKATILVPQMCTYKEEIFSLLDELGFAHVVSVSKFKLMIERKKAAFPYDETIDVIRQKWETDEKKKTDQVKKNEAELREHISTMRRRGEPDFGSDQFYQSFERIGLYGLRPTSYRIKKYELEQYLNKDMDVLDIGCNSGFLDMSIASEVKTITGVEYDTTLTEIADFVRDWLHIDNCYFVNKDFDDWYKTNKKKWDLIFSFAIHHWLNLPSEEYAARLDVLIKEGGYVGMESHDLSAGEDEEYNKCIETLCRYGYIICTECEIMDDGMSPRKFKLMQKKIFDDL
jgi:SAM-dependent methyltransferase